MSISRLSNSMSMQANGPISPMGMPTQMPAAPQLPSPGILNQAMGLGASAAGIAGSMGQEAYGFVSPHLKRNLSSLGGMVTGYGSNFLNQGQSFAAPGVLNIQNSGVLPNMFRNMAPLYRPNQMQNLSYGALQDAHSRGAGMSMYNNTQALLGGGLSTVASLGLGTIGGKAGMSLGLTGLSGMIAPTAAAMMAAKFNPLEFGRQEMMRINQFGSAANRSSLGILRGENTGALRSGLFSINQQAEIGRGIARDTYDELTYNAGDISGLQESFASSGLMRGSTSSEKYISRFKELLRTHKQVAKSLQLSTQEAVQYMESMDFQSGLSSRRSIGDVYAAAHLSGMSPMEVANSMASGARGFSQAGFRAGAGALTSLGAIQTAGQVYSGGNIDNSLLSTVGGERGIADILQNATTRFLQGNMGAINVLGGREGSLNERIMKASRSVQSEGDLINYAANYDTMNEQFAKDVGPQGAQSEMIEAIYVATKQIRSDLEGRDLYNMMKLVAVNLGYARSPAEAEILLRSIPDIQSTLSKTRSLKMQAKQDMIRDLSAEKYGLSTAPERFARSVKKRMGAQYLGEAFNKFSANLGQQTETISRALDNKIMGVQGEYITVAEAKALQESDFDPSMLGSGPKDLSGMNQGVAKKLKESAAMSMSKGERVAFDRVMNGRFNKDKQILLAAVSTGDIKKIKDTLSILRYSGHGHEATQRKRDLYQSLGISQQAEGFEKGSDIYNQAQSAGSQMLADKEFALAFSETGINQDQVRDLMLDKVKPEYSQEKMSQDFQRSLGLFTEKRLFFPGHRFKFESGGGKFGLVQGSSHEKYVAASQDPQFLAFVRAMESGNPRKVGLALDGIKDAGIKEIAKELLNNEDYYDYSATKGVRRGDEDASLPKFENVGAVSEDIKEYRKGNIDRATFEQGYGELSKKFLGEKSLAMGKDASIGKTNELFARAINTNRDQIYKSLEERDQKRELDVDERALYDMLSGDDDERFITAGEEYEKLAALSYNKGKGSASGSIVTGSRVTTEQQAVEGLQTYINTQTAILEKIANDIGAKK
jgi:hypothetical protein